MKATIRFNDEDRPVRYTFESICLMQELYGFNPFEDTCWDASPKWVSVLAWGAILHDEPKLTLDAVRKGIDLADYRTIAKTCYEALAAVLPKKDAEPAGQS